GDLPVAADDVAALLAGDLFEVRLQLLEELVLLALAVLPDEGRGRQQGADADVVEVRLQIAAVHVGATGQAEAEDDGLGRPAGVDGDTVGVGLWGVEEIGEIAV